MEIKLWHAVVKYFAPIFLADESGREGESYEEEWGGRREARGRAKEKTGGKKAQAAITKRQETIIIAP